MWRQEGVRSFYKGITPRVLRVAPGTETLNLAAGVPDLECAGQAVVFAVYERVREAMESMKHTDLETTYSE